jgi:hypothetical protein
MYRLLPTRETLTPVTEVSVLIGRIKVVIRLKPQVPDRYMLTSVTGFELDTFACVVVGPTGSSPKIGLVDFINNHHTGELQSQVAGDDELPETFRLASRLGEDRIEQAVDQYLGGASSRKIARSLGVSKTGLLELLRSRGVPIRQRRVLTNEQIAEGARLYASGLLLREVAERFDVSTEQARQALLRDGVRMRPGRGGRRRR